DIITLNKMYVSYYLGPVKIKLYGDEDGSEINKFSILQLSGNRLVYQSTEDDGSAWNANLDFTDTHLHLVDNDGADFNTTYSITPEGFITFPTPLVWEGMSNNPNQYIKINDFNGTHYNTCWADLLDATCNGDENATAYITSDFGFTTEIVTRNPWYVIEYDENNTYCAVKLTYNTSNYLAEFIDENNNSGSETLDYNITNGNVVSEHDGAVQTDTLMLDNDSNLIISYTKTTNGDSTMNSQWFKNRVDAINFANSRGKSCDTELPQENLGFTTSMIENKKYYMVDYNDFGYDGIGEPGMRWNVAEYNFNISTVGWTEITVGDGSTFTMDYNITNGIVNINGEYWGAQTLINQQTDYLEVNTDGGIQRWYFDKTKALEYAASQNPSATTYNTYTYNWTDVKKDYRYMITGNDVNLTENIFTITANENNNSRSRAEIRSDIYTNMIETDMELTSSGYGVS
ncbi:MAG: hypothetical protein KAJ49_05020, partial [Arcobacteraceae bacterium]|nr:hypothetical protein [Arcobacteraceae bacterium]